MKQIIFRADSNHSIGMGHVMRCLSIADAAMSVGCEVQFIISDDTVSDLIQERGYKAIVLNSDYKSMELELKLWPKDLRVDYLIVDSYYVTKHYLLELKHRVNATGGKLVYIDDVLSFPYPVDILIDYGVYSDEIAYHTLYKGEREEPRFILGVLYTPLRAMFRRIAPRIQPVDVKNVLVSTGGSDELHLSLAIVYELIGTEPSIRFDRFYHILLGTMNPDKEEIKKIASETDNIFLYENVTDMKSLIESCDLAVSAAGSTLYEIAVCGVPLITYSIADNQIPGAESFERLGLAVNVGDLRDLSSADPNLVMSGSLDTAAVHRIIEAVENLSFDYDRRMAMGARLQEMIDGFGADRMVQEILSE